jgi:hypothetical protein
MRNVKEKMGEENVKQYEMETREKKKEKRRNV